MRNLLVPLLLVSALACDGTIPKSQPGNPSIKGGTGAEIYPLADGGAYLVKTLEKRPTIFFLSGAKAAPVRGISGSSGAEAAVFPMPDGTAYLLLPNEKNDALYLLKESEAKLIEDATEIPPVGGVTLSPGDRRAGFLWALLQLKTKQLRDQTVQPTDDPNADMPEE